jgi:hypothetical protein
MVKVFATFLPSMLILPHLNTLNVWNYDGNDWVCFSGFQAPLEYDVFGVFWYFGVFLVGAPYEIHEMHLGVLT